MKHTAYEIVQALQGRGFEAYWVGGCVRDLILHHEPKDYDIVTNALPEEVEDIFPDTKPLGKEFGIILVIENGHPFEVATFRSDGDYSDGRRPEKVHFCSAEEDALRRDFTINGIFYDPITDVYKDFVQGRSDLRRGVLRFIGDPEERIREDHLRVLRAIRFKNRFELDYHKDTREALKLHSSLIVSVSVERILDELNRMLLDQHRKKAFEDMDMFGIGEILLPEIWDLKHVPQPPDHHREGNVFNHTLDVIDQFRPGVTLPAVWGALLHDIGKFPTMHYEGERMRFSEHPQEGAEIAKGIVERFKFPKALGEAIYWLVYNHHIFDQWDDVTVGRRLQYFDHPNFQDLLNLHRADIFGSTPSEWDNRNFLRIQIEEIQKEFYAAHENEDVPSKTPELLSGSEIMNMLDLEPGPKVGELKQALRDKQMNGKIKTREEAVEWMLNV